MSEGGDLLHGGLRAWRPGPGEEPELRRDEMLRYLGHTGQELEPDLARRIEEAAVLATRDARIRGAYRVFGVDPTGTDAQGAPCIRLQGARIELRGRDIYRHLKDARACAVLCCTIGMGTERRLRALAASDALAGALYDAACSAYAEDAVEALDGCAVLCCTIGMGTERRLRALAASDALAGALYDAACSAYAEDAVEALDGVVRREAAGLGLHANWRFSCGYGDCPLDAQPQILAALDAQRRCGVCATDSSLLLPSKSVTAMIGLFDGEPSDAGSRPSCAICRLRGSCGFRARKTTCY